MTLYQDDYGQFETYTWPGGYPTFQILADGAALCCSCANNTFEVGIGPDTPEAWRVVASEINWEDPELFCAHCGKRIESAYEVETQWQAGGRDEAS